MALTLKVYKAVNRFPTLINSRSVKGNLSLKGQVIKDYI